MNENFRSEKKKEKCIGILVLMGLKYVFFTSNVQNKDNRSELK